MEITRTSMLSGKTRTMDLDVTEQQIYDWKAGALIQDAMPQLNASEREFIKTGITDKEWNSIPGED